MSYVVAGYAVTLGGLAAYAAHVILRARRLSRAGITAPAGAGAPGLGEESGEGPRREGQAWQ